MLPVRLDVTNGYTVCRPVSELDAYSAPGLRESMALLTSVPRLVLDLSEVPFIDSAGLVALDRRRARRHRPERRQNAS